MRAATEMVKTPASQRRWLAGLWRRCPRPMGWALLAPVIVGVLFIAQAYLLAQVLDAAIRLEQPMGTLGGAIGGVAALIVIRGFVSWSGGRSARRAVEQTKDETRAQVFAPRVRQG